MDCIEYMRSLPDNTFDIAVCDPPYGKGNDDSLVVGGGDSDSGSSGITAHWNRFSGGKTMRRYYTPPPQSDWNRLRGGRRERYYSPIPGRNMGDEIQSANRGGISEAPTWDVAPPQEFFDELFRVSKNQIIWGGNYFTLPPTRCFLVWKKHIPETFSMAMCEYAWTSFTGNAKVFECPSLRGKHSGKFHPTEKPLALYGWIYRNYVKEGQTVFDPMMGSQASRIAAYMMDIDYVGCEIDKYYFEKGCEWFNRECHGVIKTHGGREITEQTLF